jgi:hypothetical protein
MLLMAMVFVCTTVGWLIVALPRWARNSERAVASAPAANAPTAETERKPEPRALAYLAHFAEI